MRYISGWNWPGEGGCRMRILMVRNGKVRRDEDRRLWLVGGGALM